MMITKTLNLFIAGSLFAIGGTAYGQHAPATPPEGEPPRAPQQQQRQMQPPEEPPTRQAPEQDPAEMQEKLEGLRGEVEEISLRLNDIHQEALLETDVRKSLVKYETTFNEAIGDSAPGLEAQVEAHAEVLEDIDAIDDNGDKDKLEGLLEKYNEVKQQLAPVESQLFNNEELLAARTEYQEDLIEAMNVVEPNVEEIIQQRMDLAQEFMALQQEFLQSQQSQQGQAPQQGQPPQQGQQRQAPPQSERPQGQAPRPPQ